MSLKIPQQVRIIYLIEHRVIFMKKRGFTLVELIAAMAILAISLTAISSAMITTVKINGANNLKMDNENYAESIVETFKGGGKSSLAFKTSTSLPVSCFLYFDDKLLNFSTSMDPAIKYLNFNAWFNSSDKVSGIVSNDDNNSHDENLFNKCVTLNTNNNKYGAYLIIENDSTSDNTYYMKLIVWNLKGTNGNEIIREMYISR